MSDSILTPQTSERCQVLAQLVQSRVEEHGEWDSRVPGLHMTSLTHPIENPNCFYVLSVGMILQGQKRLLIGGETVDYKAGMMLVTSIDLPTSYEIGCSAKEPFISLSLKLNPSILAELLAEDVYPQGESKAFCFDKISEELIEDFDRLIRLLDHPAQLTVRAPLLIRDIHYLALSGAGSESLRALYAPSAAGQRIRQSIRWLRDNFREPITIEQLAQVANMAPATYHKQFKRLTSLSPMQYQKRLRLYEAQQFLLNGEGDVNSAAFAVGYVSPQQFNRDYKKLFGETPGRSTKTQRSNLQILTEDELLEV